MQQFPNLIIDLAIILMTAGFVTLIFKRLKQPLVLGYIVAGFIVSRNMPYTPSISDIRNIDIWAQIGIIFLMFSLGLEFSFKKIIKMGAGPVIAACTIIFCMIGLGSATGHLFGWSKMDCLFLGGMLAMSSTTIIYKAFTDMGLRHHRFSGQVLSVLVLEDILGILLMVVLSTVAVSRNVEGMDLVGSMLRLGFVLALWFLVGIFLIPLFLRKNRKWIGRETLLVVSLGLCFGMVVLAENMGYSAAFGAFMMGSILAETIEAESINKLVAPVKDLFGAIFFVSVGMLVDPSVVMEFWFPILILTLTILLGQAIFGTSGFLLSGQSLKVSVQCGFSMAQIGEFAFIIASLGVSLHVTGHFLYPVVVAVSVITTFLTPYMIRLSGPAYLVLEKIIPRHLRRTLNQQTPGTVSVNHETLWKKLLIALSKQILAYSILGIAVITLSLSFLLRLTRETFGHWTGNAICGLITIIAISPFLRAIVMRKNHSEEFKGLWNTGTLNRFPLIFTVLARFMLCCGFVFYIINYLSPFHSILHWFVSMGLVLLMVGSRNLKRSSIKLERTFLQNLRSRDLEAEVTGKIKPRYATHLLSRDVHLTDLEVPINTLWGGKSLRDLDFSRKDNVTVSSILRGNRRINIPGANAHIFPGDRIQLIGDDESLKRFAQRMETEVFEDDISIEAREMTLRYLVIDKDSPFKEKTMKESLIREQYNCMIVGFEEGKDSLGLPYAERIFKEGDIVWIVGEKSSLQQLLGKVTY